jgi:transcriptional regulator with XRE-family HTH domain
MYLADKIKSLREKRKWSYSELARVTGIPQPTIWRLEKGNIAQPKADTLVALAKAFGVPVDYLVHEDYKLDTQDMLRTDVEIRTMAEAYALLSREDRARVTQLVENLKPIERPREKRRFVDVRTKARRVVRE